MVILDKYNGSWNILDYPSVLQIKQKMWIQEHYHSKNKWRKSIDKIYFMSQYISLQVKSKKTIKLKKQ